MERINRVLRSYIENGLTYGASALVTKNGKEIFFGSAGIADKDNDVPFERDTVLRVFSMTKPVTAVAAMMLVERGVFSLNTPISEFIPEYKNATVCEEIEGKVEIVPAKREITVFHLLTMTSGLSYGDKNDINNATTESNEHLLKFLLKMRELEKSGTPVGTVTLARHLAACPLGFHPGEKWRYGMSSDVLGAVVAAASGKSLGEFFRENIFEPIGMDNTCFNKPTAPEKILSKLAKSYIPSPHGLIEKKRPLVFEMAAHPTFEAGGAGLLSTLDDYSKFGNMLLSGGEIGGVRILKEETVRQMRSPQITEQQAETYDWNSERGYSYGLSMRMLTDASKTDYVESVGSFGWNGAAGTSLRMDPVRGTVLVFGCQRLPADHELFLPQLTEAVSEFERSL